VFYSDVRDLIQTVVLPDATTQTQNVGNGDFSGVELSVDAPLGSAVRAGGHYTLMHRNITDALQPSLRPTGVPTNRVFLHASWQPAAPVRITPSLELAGDRWSDVNPAPAFPYVKTGSYTLLDLDATYTFGPLHRTTASSRPRTLDVTLGFKNLLDDHYELSWGYPQPGRTFYVKTRMLF
jgi:iron complex outermembrane receptor protein